MYALGVCRNLQSHLLMELNQLKKKVDMLRRHRNKKVLEDEALVQQYLWDLKGPHKDQQEETIDFQSQEQQVETGSFVRLMVSSICPCNF